VKIWERCCVELAKCVVLMKNEKQNWEGSSRSFMHQGWQKDDYTLLVND
jgi:hypothetical protein